MRQGLSTLNNCEQIPVTFTYQYCNYIQGNGKVFVFDEEESWYTLGGNRITPGLDLTTMDGKETCRIKEIDTIINTCKNETLAVLNVTGRSSPQDPVCNAFYQMRVLPVNSCNYNFIITGMMDPIKEPNYDVIKIYTAKCGGEITRDNLHLVIFIGASRNPTLVPLIRVLKFQPMD